MLPGLKHLSYDQRLTSLKIPSMKHQFFRGDLIEVLKWFHVYKCEPKLFDASKRTITRGHHFKLQFSRLDV